MKKRKIIKTIFVTLIALSLIVFGIGNYLINRFAKGVVTTRDGLLELNRNLKYDNINIKDSIMTDLIDKIDSLDSRSLESVKLE